MELDMIRKIKRENLYYSCGILLYICAYLGICITPAMTYWGYLSLCRKLFSVSMGLTIPAILLIWKGKTRISDTVKKQMLLIYTIFSVIFTVLMTRNIISNLPRHIPFMILEGIIVYLGLIFWGIMTFCNKRLSLKLRIKEYIVRNRFLICISILILLLSLEQIHASLRWDSIHYYAYIERIKDFIFSPNDILLFKASGHLSYGYVLLYSVGESILPGFGYGVRIETIIFFIISIIVLEKFLILILPRGERFVRQITVCLYSVTPVILGPIHNIDVEILSLTLLILLFYCYTKKYYILSSIIATFLVFTKETCALIIVAFLVADIGYHFVRSFIKHKWSILFNKNTIVSFFSLYIPLFVFLIHISLNTTWGSTKAAEEVDKFNTWGINNTVILNKLEQLFVMNFSWITTTIIVVGIICRLIKIYKGKASFKISNIYIQIFGTYVTFLFIQLAYITYTFPRYLMLQYFFVAIFFQWACNQINVKRTIKISVGVFVIILTFLQNFYSLDIISNNLFDTIKIGKTKMLVNSPIVYLNNQDILYGNEAKFLMFSPYADVNRQWSYFDKLINKFLTEIKYEDNTLVVYPDSFSPRSENIYFGMWNNTYYDTKSKRLVQVIDSSETPNEDWEFYNATIDNEQPIDWDKYDIIYYLEFPYDEIDSNIATIAQSKINVSYRGWSLNAYKVKGDL